MLSYILAPLRNMVVPMAIVFARVGVCVGLGFDELFAAVLT